MSSPFIDLMAGLNRQRGVLGTIVASESDGIVIDANVQIGVKAPVVAALAASLYRKARLSTSAAGYGEVGFLQLEAERGWVCTVGREDLVVVVVAGPRANVGLIRVAMLRARETLA